MSESERIEVKGIRGICPHCHKLIRLEPAQMHQLITTVLENMLVAMRGVREK